MEIKNTFLEHGYIRQSLLSMTEVMKLRAIILDYYEQKYGTSELSRKQMIFPKHFIEHPILMQYVLRDNLIHALKKILIPRFMIIPDFLVTINSLYLNGWHVDGGDEIKRSLFKSSIKNILNPEYQQVKCGIFLQDNTTKYAGGIDILPKYHKMPLKTPSASLNMLIHKLARSLMVKKYSQKIQTKAGDLVVFDHLLPHKGSHPDLSFFDNVSQEDRGNHIIPMRGFPREHIKMVIYFSACMPKKSDIYMQNMQQRAAESPFFEHVANVQYPDDFNKNHLDLITKYGIDIAVAPVN